MYPTLKKEPTERQRAILDFLSAFIQKNGYPPSLREICGRFNIKSPKNAAKHLDALRKKGLIKRTANISRAIDVIGSYVKNVVSIPVVGRVRAGLPNLAVEDVTGHVTLDADFFRCQDAFILTADGDSMTGAGIEDGDYLVVRPTADVSTGDIAVVMIGSEATVKRFLRAGDDLVLKAENPAYPPIHIKEGHEFSIVGKVVMVIKRIEK